MFNRNMFSLIFSIRQARRKMLLLALPVFVFGCKSYGSGGVSTHIRGSTDACVVAAHQSGLKIVGVWSMEEYSIKGIAKALTGPSRPPVFVFGENPKRVTTVLAAVFSKFPFAPGRPPQFLCVPSDVQITPQIQQAADAANIKILVINDPDYAAYRKSQ